MPSPSQPPWTNPPKRKKTLQERKAEKIARKAAFWGERLTQAVQEGPREVAIVQWDRAKAVLNRLPDNERDRAYAVLADAIDRVREAHAE